MSMMKRRLMPNVRCILLPKKVASRISSTLRNTLVSFSKTIRLIPIILHIRCHLLPLRVAIRIENSH